MTDNLHQALKQLIADLELDAEGYEAYDRGDVAVGINLCITELQTRLEQFPEPETTTEWGTRTVFKGEPIDLNCYEAESAARYYAAHDNEELITREVTAWKKADQ